MNDKLKPCPFCGNKSVRYYSGATLEGLVDLSGYIYCNQCCAQFSFNEDDFDKTKDQWNKRDKPIDSKKE